MSEAPPGEIIWSLEKKPSCKLYQDGLKTFPTKSAVGKFYNVKIRDVKMNIFFLLFIKTCKAVLFEMVRNKERDFSKFEICFDYFLPNTEGGDDVSNIEYLNLKNL